MQITLKKNFSLEGDCELCEIDSRVMNIRVGRIWAEKIAKEDLTLLPDMLRKAKYSLIYWIKEKLPQDNNGNIRQSVDQMSLKPFSENVEYKKEIAIQKVNIQKPLAEIIPCTEFPKGKDQINSLVIQCNEYSHLFRDPLIPNICADNIYLHWLDNGNRGRLNKRIFLAMKESQVIGLIIFSFSGENGRIEILSVKDDKKRQGIGSLLLNKAEKFLAKIGVKFLSLQTQALNGPACAFYKKNGFTERQRFEISHLWL